MIILDWFANIVMWLFTMITWYTNRIIYTVLFVLALLVPFFIGQYLDNELFTGWTYVGNSK
jgi:hypothetical protein